MSSLQPCIGSRGWRRPLLGRPQQTGLGNDRTPLLSLPSLLPKTVGTIMPMHCRNGPKAGQLGGMLGRLHSASASRDLTGCLSGSCSIAPSLSGQPKLCSSRRELRMWLALCAVATPHAVLLLRMALLTHMDGTLRHSFMLSLSVRLFGRRSNGSRTCGFESMAAQHPPSSPLFGCRGATKRGHRTGGRVLTCGIPCGSLCWRRSGVCGCDASLLGSLSALLRW